MLWKLEVLVDLVILESVKVKDDPLQMYNQNIRSLSQQSSLAHVNFLLATAALIFIDNLAFNKCLEALLHSFDVFDSE